MKQIKKYIILFIICLSIILIIIKTPRKNTYIEEHFGPLEDAARAVFDGLISPVNNIISALPNKIAKDAGITNVVSLISRLTDMMGPTETILKNLFGINSHIQKILSQLNIDSRNITKVQVTIKKCIQRIEYSRQRLQNIPVCIHLLSFMIQNIRIKFIFNSTKLLIVNIIETINYIKMVIRTNYIDLHNTSPSLWEVINFTEYKKNIIAIIKYLKSIALSTNKIIDLSALSLGDIENLLAKPLIRIHDHDNNREKIANFKNMLNISKILIINMQPISINMDNEILYNIMENITMAFTIPPGKNFKYNKNYINSHIKNKPY